MAKFHVNDKGEPGPCHARRSCPFGSLEADHYDSPEEARRAYEEKRPSFPIPTDGGKRYDWPQKSVTRSFQSKRTPGGQVILQISEAMTRMSTPHMLQAWLEVPGKGNVAYVQLLVRGEGYMPEVGEHLMMCDIETRPDARKQGFARELRESVAEEVGLEIYSSGNMTPEGWEAFGKHVKLLPDPYASGGDRAGVKYDSMGFVASWKKRVPRNVHRCIEYADEQRDALWRLAEEGTLDRLDRKEILWAEE